jgi:hypothetical protein
VGPLPSVLFGDDDLAALLRLHADLPRRAAVARDTKVHFVLSADPAHHTVGAFQGLLFLVVGEVIQDVDRWLPGAAAWASPPLHAQDNNSGRCPTQLQQIPVADGAMVEWRTGCTRHGTPWIGRTIDARHPAKLVNNARVVWRIHPVEHHHGLLRTGHPRPATKASIAAGPPLTFTRQRTLFRRNAGADIRPTGPRRPAAPAPRRRLNRDPLPAIGDVEHAAITEAIAFTEGRSVQGQRDLLAWLLGCGNGQRRRPVTRSPTATL